MKKVLVIGAGVCGLASAVQLAEFYGNSENVQVVLVSEKFSPDTTGDGSAGLWSPYLCTTDKTVLHWSQQTHKFFTNLWQRGLASEVGLALLPMMRLTSESKYEDADWLHIPYGASRMSDRQLERLSAEYQKPFTAGIHFVSFTVDVHRLLPYLQRRFESAGGTVRQAKIDSLSCDELAAFDLVVNCTGLGARDLVDHESDLHPIRGQVNRVLAPWIYQVILDDDDVANYVIPNSETVILGGTHEYHSFNTEVSQKDDSFIMEGCQKIVPGLKHAPLMQQWVGLRPGRSSIRLEVEKTTNGRTIVHNYGHGGSGVTLSWGCATSVLDQVRLILGDNNNNNNSSWPAPPVVSKL